MIFTEILPMSNCLTLKQKYESFQKVIQPYYGYKLGQVLKDLKPSA